MRAAKFGLLLAAAASVLVVKAAEGEEEKFVTFMPATASDGMCLLDKHPECCVGFDLNPEGGQVEPWYGVAANSRYNLEEGDGDGNVCVFSTVTGLPGGLPPPLSNGGLIIIPLVAGSTADSNAVACQAALNDVDGYEAYDDAKCQSDCMATKDWGLTTTALSIEKFSDAGPRIPIGPIGGLTDGTVLWPQCPYGSAAPHKLGARKDPHFRFAHGGRADIRGEDGAIFNFLSAKNISLNIGFEAADFRWSAARLVHGTRIHAAYWTILAANGKTITVAYAADKNTTRHAAVTVSGTDAPIRVTAAKPFSMGDVRVSLKERALTVVGARWSTTATANAFPFASLNKDKVLLDLEVKPLYDADTDEVAPHGLWGQSHDGDNIAVDGKLDKPKGPEMTTVAQGEGAIEGTVGDYKMAGPFATDFKYSRYAVTSAKHRDVSKLAGAKNPNKMKGGVATPGARGVAGADDATVETK